MNPRTLTLALGQIGITVLFLQEIACSGGERSDGADEDANEIETVSQSILNGPQTVNPQVVDLGGCTGTLLTPEWVLTARHCVPNKLWTAGTLTDLDADRVNRGVHLPAGKTGSNVIEVAVNKTASQTAGDQLKMYFSDGTCTLWSWPYGPWPTGSLELDATCNFLSALPGGRTPSQIVGITSTQTPGQTPTMYVYFNDGWYASGADPNLGGLTLIGQYTMDVAHNPSNILSMALNQSNQTYTWFDDGTRSVGTYGDLDATSTPTAYSGPAQAGSVANIRGIGIRLNGASVRTYYNVNGAIHTSQGGSFDLDSMFDGVPVKGATGASTTNGPGATGGDAGEIAQDTDVRGIAISKTTSKVYTWHRNGVVSVGDSIRLDLYNKAYPFSPPLNYTPDQLVGVGISMNSERVYYWWNNGWRTWGTSSDATSNGAWYTLPPGYSISQIAAIDIDQNDRIQVFYTDGKYSTGTSTDFDAYTAPTPYSLSSATGFNLTTSDLLEVAINSSGRVHAWYRSKPKTIISNASGSSESRSTVGWINFWSPDLDASMLRVSPAFTTVAPAYRLSPSPIYTAVGTSLTCYGYGGAFVLEWTSQPVSVGSWIDSFDPYLGPVMGANYAITPNGLGQTTEPGDSGGPCMASLGTATVLAGVHHTAPLPGGGNPSQDTMAIHIGKWALERGVHYVEQVRTPRILCHAVQCFSAPDPMPTNSTFPTVNWNPCNGGSFSWYASIETTSPDYVRIGATSYSGATSPSGTASGTLSVFAQSYGSGTSKGLKNLYATCN